MREYTLNDSSYNPDPLTLYVPTGTESKVDDAQLQESFKRNREMMHQMEAEFNERKKKKAII